MNQLFIYRIEASGTPEGHTGGKQSYSNDEVTISSQYHGQAPMLEQNIAVSISQSDEII